MKSPLILFVILINMFVFAAAIQAEDGISTLRGSRALSDPSVDPTIKSWQADQAPISREFVHQPPLIPHTIEAYKINLKFNKCLTCHSWANYKEAGATKISLTHFTDRDGNDLANVSSRRYFCTQCHVSQVNAPPLVDNTFESVESIRGR